MNLFAVVAIVIVVAVVVALVISTLTKNNNVTAEIAEDSNSSDQMSAEEKEQYKKEKQEREWSDPNEHAKYVCHGGKVQCRYCNVPISDILVTSNTIMLQDKPWATIQDKDGLVNFNFTGQCLHPSQQRPLSPPPPCKAVINLGNWRNFSQTIIDKYNALVVQSTIPCMISGEDLQIVDSGQKAELSQIEQEQKKVPKIVRMYWMDETGSRKIKRLRNKQTAILYVHTKNYEAESSIKINFRINDTEIVPLIGVVGENNLAKIQWTYNKQIE